MVSSVFVRQVEDECDDALCALGARRLRRGDCRFELSEDVLFWIGRNQGRHDDFLRINPNVGLHIISMEKLENQLSGEKYKKGGTATYSIPLGTLCPDEDQFIFTERSDITLEAKRLAQTIVDFGMPYAQKYSSLEAILPKIAERIPRRGAYPERYAVGLYLLGRTAEVRDFLSQQISFYKLNQSQDIQDDFAKFSDLLLQKIES